MTYDLYFWPSGAADDIFRLADQLAEEEAEDLAPDARVLTFRAELLRRWPDLADHLEPWHHDAEWITPGGRTDLADRYVLLTLPYSWHGISALPALAGWYGLDCYNPQAEQLVASRLRLQASDSGGPADITEIEGQVADNHVVRLCQQVSAFINYRYDELDEVALVGALDDTDDQASDAWFEYPLQGAPPLTIRLAQSSDGTRVSVRIEGSMDLVLATRIESLLDIL
ncbi:hypothetical protein [Virgisporangium aurantiacum]|uniref:hypothetical protein n=1 Tax=Virgisporangium aurantiacum TaxID=175570 RepID=UPI0019515FB7|nr:hypothetical protein [Virgisporangium aurantiacum]